MDDRAFTGSHYGLAGCSVTFLLQFDGDAWHTFTLEMPGDAMRATIGGKLLAWLGSPGIAHATKSKVESGCTGKDGFPDDVKIWNAEVIK